jgi:formyl-CoA transferase
LDCTLASLVNVAQAHLVSRQAPIRYGNAHAQIVPYQCFATADGHLVLAIGNDEQWQRFCRAAGCDELAADARFTTNPLRVENRAALVPQLAKLLKNRSTDEWNTLLAAADVSSAPVLGVPAAVAHPQVLARNMVVEATMADAAQRSVELIGSPIRIEGVETASPTCPPRLGEHTEAVLADLLGYSAERIAALRSQEVIA